MTLSSKQIGDIANLYESITAYEQEQLVEGPYSADSVRAAQEAARKREQERSNRSARTNDAVQAARSKEANAAPAGSSPKQMQQAAVQGMLDRQKARGGPNNGWNRENLTKAINPKYTPQNVARAQQAVGIKPAINPTPTTKPRGSSNPPARPAAPSVAKVAPTKPAGSAPAGSAPAGSAMDQWRAANPKLAAAADEKARIRGTQQTDNPLMKDMRSRLPMNSPSVQAPAVAKLGAGNQSLVNNPNAFKAAPEIKKTATIAAAPKPAPVAPAKTSIAASYEYEDAYDLVLEYLLDNGHVDSVEEAHYVMLEMNSETIQGIVEGAYEDRIAANNKKYDAARKRAAQRAAARNAARDAGKTGSVPGVGYVTPRRERETYTDAAGTERHHSGAKAK